VFSVANVPDPSSLLLFSSFPSLFILSSGHIFYPDSSPIFPCPSERRNQRLRGASYAEAAFSKLPATAACLVHSYLDSHHLAHPSTSHRKVTSLLPPVTNPRYISLSPLLSSFFYWCPRSTTTTTPQRVFPPSRYTSSLPHARLS
jgi:hypothetical protein